jgi:hypothetical protein
MHNINFSKIDVVIELLFDNNKKENIIRPYNIMKENGLKSELLEDYIDTFLRTSHGAMFFLHRSHKEALDGIVHNISETTGLTDEKVMFTLFWGTMVSKFSTTLENALASTGHTSLLVAEADKSDYDEIRGLMELTVRRLDSYAKGFYGNSSSQ